MIQPYNKTLEDYTHYLQAFQWELHITTQFPDYNKSLSTIDANIEANTRFIQEVLSPLSKHLKQKLAAYSVVVPPQWVDGVFKAAHIHSLVLSYERNLDRRIDEIQAFIFSDPTPSPLLERRSETAVPCCVKPITCDKHFMDVTRYVAKNQLTSGATGHPYKDRLLHNRQCPKQERYPR